MKRRRYAQGGEVTSTHGQPIPLSRGQAVVSAEVLAAYKREYWAALNGGNTDIYSAGEVLAAYDEDE